MKDKDKKAIENAVETAEVAAEAGSLKDVCGQKGCFSYLEGHCQCLSDTDFGGRACPFFKTVKQYERDLAAHPLKAEGGEDEDDFLKSNADLINELSAMEDEAERIEREGLDMDDTDIGSDDDDWDDKGESDDNSDGGDNDGDG